MFHPKPFQQNYLPKEKGHKIFYSQYGNPAGLPIVVLHGGPGSRTKPKHSKSFNLDKYHLITFDQRGCGQSLPQGEITFNSTQDLLSDIDRLRQHLNLENWFVSGGSWGSTLALAYAQQHPQSVKGLLLSSIFLARETDINWSFTSPSHIAKIFPDVWEMRDQFFRDHNTSPQLAAQDLLDLLNNCSQEQAQLIAAGITNWESNLMSSLTDIHYTYPEEVDEETINSTKIFLHYQSNNFFLTNNQLIANIDKIESIPTILIHGRYDLLCPLDQMWVLQKSLKKCEAIILPNSNHKFTADGEIAKKLAFNYFLEKFNN